MRFKTLHRAAFLLLIVIGLTAHSASIAHAAPPARDAMQTPDPAAEEIKIFQTPGANEDLFGYDVAYSGDGTTVVIGTPYSDEGGRANSGVAYVYNRDGSFWRFRSKLVPSDPAAGDLFGSAVAISYDGGTVLVGAPFKAEPTFGFAEVGAAYVFARGGNNWTQQRRLLASDRQRGDRFGFAVSLSSDGNMALIGAPDEGNGPNFYNGAAYFLTRSGTTWTEETKLVAYDQSTDASFGYAVALSADGNRALIGAPYKAYPTNESGAAYIFSRTGTAWTVGGHLRPPNWFTAAYYGWSVALAGNGGTAIVGAPGETTSGTIPSFEGAAHVFNFTGSDWVFFTRLTAPDRQRGDRFGESVSLSFDGRTGLVGANNDDEGSFVDVGSAHVLKRPANDWVFQRKLLPSPSNVQQPYGQGFGNSVSLSANGALAIIGAPYSDTDSWTNGGVAYLYAGVQPVRGDTIGAYKDGTFHLARGNNAGTTAIIVPFGGDPSDYPVAGDWNGDKIDTVGVYRNNSGTFLLSDSNFNPAVNWTLIFGNPGDQPFAGRWTFDMTIDGVGVYRNSNGILYQKKALTTGFSDFYAVFGNPGDQPVAGDWNNEATTVSASIAAATRRGF
jgi:hypothetical protein